MRNVLKKNNEKTNKLKNLTKQHQNKLKHLVSKLLILLVVNVTMSFLALAVIYAWMSYVAAALDLLISNICLWLTFKFNQSYFHKYCKPCIRCCYR